MEVAKILPAKSQELIICDPPYFEVKGDFDFIWDSFEDYLKDVEKWAIELKRILADNGTLFWWGHAKKIAYSQIILDKYFNLENNLKWEKIECQTKRVDFEQSRCFAPITEHCLMYSNEVQRSSLDEIKSDPNLFLSIKKYLREEKSKSGLTLTDLNLILVNKKQSDCIAKRYFGDSLWELPTKEMYKKLQSTGFFDKEYEELRKEYEELRRPFNNYGKLTDVLKFSQEAHITKRYDHDTKKPLGITKALVKTCSKKGQNMFIPFGGSGTETEVGINEGLKVIVCEMEEKHCITIDKRIETETLQQTLF
jgi:site-specific DNA-methyltransferase (adenine-specific)